MKIYRVENVHHSKFLVTEKFLKEFLEEDGTECKVEEIDLTDGYCEVWEFWG